MRRIIVGVALLAALGLLTLAALGAGDDASPRVIRSTGGMEGMTEVAVQVHVAGGDDWRALVGIDEGKLQSRVEELLRRVPGLTVVDENVDEQTPRVLVLAVGHVIADPAGNKDTIATNLTMNLDQQVSLRRPLPGGRPALVMGTTWQRSVLLTGAKGKMRTQVAENLAGIADEFREDYARANR